jgi:hypothetical protein
MVQEIHCYGIKYLALFSFCSNSDYQLHHHHHNHHHPGPVWALNLISQIRGRIQMEVVQEEMPQSISDTKKEEAMENCIQLHSMELHNSYSLPNTSIIELIKLQVLTGGSRGSLGRKDRGILGFGRKT